MGVETSVPVAELARKRGPSRTCLAALALISAATALPARSQTPAAPSPDYRTPPAPTAVQKRTNTAGCDRPLAVAGRVRSVIDGRTLVLEDGREVRLAAIEVAPLAGAGEQPHGGAGRAAQRALSELALGRAIALSQDTGSADRYGRTLAHAAVSQDQPERSLQQELLAQGHARLGARVEPAACLAELRARERHARQAALGLWADPYYSAQAADRPGDIAARRGQFTVVEGDVVSVRESRGTTYINFGRRWSESFAAVILKRNAGALLAAGINPKLLQGRRVEVRGFVELRGGPRMEIMRPEQLNVVR